MNAFKNKYFQIIDFKLTKNSEWLMLLLFYYSSISFLKYSAGLLSSAASRIIS